MTDQLTVYHIPKPQTEFKAAQEMDRGGFSYVLPSEKIERRTAGRKPTVRNVPLMRSYLPANGKPRDAKYVGRAIGTVDRVEIIKLQANADRLQRRSVEIIPFKPGQTAFKGDIPVRVASITGRFCRIEWDMLGKRQTQSIHYTKLRPG